MRILAFTAVLAATVATPALAGEARPAGTMVQGGAMQGGMMVHGGQWRQAAPAMPATPGVQWHHPVIKAPVAGMPATPPAARWGGKVNGRWYGGVYAPGGWSAYRRPARGWMLPTYWFAPSFYVTDYAIYGLGAPANGYTWVRYYDDAVLVDGRGRVYDTVSGINWDRYDDGYAFRGDGYDGGYDRSYQGHSDGRPNDGYGGAVVGGAAGAVAGNLIAGAGSRLAGSLIGGGVGMLAGWAIDKAITAEKHRKQRKRYSYAQPLTPPGQGYSYGYQGQGAYAPPPPPPPAYGYDQGYSYDQSYAYDQGDYGYDQGYAYADGTVTYDGYAGGYIAGQPYTTVTRGPGTTTTVTVIPGTTTTETTEYVYEYAAPTKRVVVKKAWKPRKVAYRPAPRKRVCTCVWR